MYWSEQKRVSSLSTDSGHPQSVISLGETASEVDLLSMDVRERSLVFTNLSEDLQEAIVLSRRIRSGSDPSDKQETAIDNKVCMNRLYILCVHVRLHVYTSYVCTSVHTLLYFGKEVSQSFV